MKLKLNRVFAMLIAFIAVACVNSENQIVIENQPPMEYLVDEKSEFW